MTASMPIPAQSGKSLSRGEGPQAVQAAFGNKSLDGAQKKIDRSFEEAERVGQVLALNGVTQPIVNHIAAMHAILDDAPAGEITQTLRTDGQVDRSQDDARDECLVDGCKSIEHLQTLRHRTNREINAKFRLLRDIDSRITHLRRHGAPAA